MAIRQTHTEVAETKDTSVSRQGVVDQDGKTVV